MVFTDNDTTLRKTRHAYIKETLRQNPKKPYGMIYELTIKPIDELYQVKFGYNAWGPFSSTDLRNGPYIRKN